MKYHRSILVLFFLVAIVSSASSTALVSRNAPQESDRDRNRDAWQRPAEVFDALGLKPGHKR